MDTVPPGVPTGRGRNRRVHTRIAKQSQAESIERGRFSPSGGSVVNHRGFVPFIIALASMSILPGVNFY